MMATDLPPEERLLRLIKGTHGRERPADEENFKTQSVNGGERGKKQNKERPALRRSFTFIDEIAFHRKNSSAFKTAIYLLVVFFVLGIFYFSYELFGQKPQPSLPDIDKLIAEDAKPPENANGNGQAPPAIPNEQAQEYTPPAQEQPPFNEDLPAGMRDLFGAPVVTEQPPLTEEGPKATDLIRDLTLLGVITGENPQAIIEDKRTHQTFYLSEGESILEFKIKKIEKATVILERNGEAVKLSL